MTDRITLSESNLDEVIREFAATPKQALAAAKRAIRKTQTFGRSRIIRALSAEHRVPGKAFRQRKRVTTKPVKVDKRDGVTAHLWIGTMPLRAIDVGKPRLPRTGVTVGKHKFAGAFIARMESGHRGVFSRRGTERLPIDEEYVRLPQSRRVIETVRDREILPRLKKLMRQELNYEVNVRGRARR